ncbi:L-rhamnose-binding lectin CSL1-like [Myxocyprinus asiaticus]|uniref:L-rhamnose-binding lectin CSL1-like n=1 Tax=Myxocyprinus asiaticus TaxID=70543 RepID=UPI002223073E|nr:L-rhamnose-binding lectin CSL1-like [Myxocyprinus asiaticus]
MNVLASKFGNTNCSAGIDPPDFSNVNCTQNTSISLVANRCDGKQNCSILVENSTFGDVCLGFYKYLKVSYICLLPKELVTCWGKTTSLTCDDFYPGTLKELSANYGCTDSSTWSDLEDYRKKCNGKKTCNLYASSLLFLDWCPNI